MRTIFAMAVAAATLISVPAIAQTGAPGSWGPGYYDNGYQSQPSWSVNYNRQGYNQTWAPGPSYYDNGYTGQSSQPSWSVNYNRQGYNPTSGQASGYAPGYYDNSYQSQPSWSVNYNRTGY
jgi:hypothetical protein